MNRHHASSYSKLLFEHDLFGRPPRVVPDHTLETHARRRERLSDGFLNAAKYRGRGCGDHDSRHAGEQESLHLNSPQIPYGVRDPEHIVRRPRTRQER